MSAHLGAGREDDDEDSDLEILPNPESARSRVLDLSQDAVEDETHAQEVSDNDNHNCRKRPMIKLEADDHANPAKKRRLNNNTNSNQDQQAASDAATSTAPEAIVPKPENTRVDKCVDINKQCTMQLGTDSPYRFFTAYPGLCYAGRCANAECVAYQEPVMATRGYGLVKPIFDEKYKVMKCPGCSKPFELKVIYLRKCLATVRYQFSNQDEVKSKEIPAIADGSFVAFGHFGDLRQKLRNTANTGNPNQQHAQPRNSNAGQATYQNMYKLLEFTVRRIEPQGDNH